MNGTATMEYISGTVDSISFSEIGFYAAATAVTLLSWTTRAATSDPPAVSTPALLSGVYVVGLSYRKLALLLFCPLNIALPAVRMCAVLPPLFIKVWTSVLLHVVLSTFTKSPCLLTACCMTGGRSVLAITCRQDCAEIGFLA
jgi:hypothetical protein